MEVRIKHFTHTTANPFFRAIPHSCPSILNPLLLWAFPPFFRSFGLCSWIGHHGNKYLNVDDFRTLDWARSSTRREAYMRREATWRNMLITQPAVTRVTVVRRYGIRHGRADTNQGLMMTDGLRMGELYDEAQGAACHDLTPNFKLIWSVDQVCLKCHQETRLRVTQWVNNLRLPEEVQSPIASIATLHQNEQERARLETSLCIEHFVSVLGNRSHKEKQTLEEEFRSLAYKPVEIIWDE